MNERIQNLRNRLFSVKHSICAERAVLFTESMKTTEGLDIAMRRAMGFRHVLENMSLYIGEDELIVGNQASRPKAAPVFPEYSIKWVCKEFEGDPYYFDKRPADCFEYTQETKDRLLEISQYWMGKCTYDRYPELEPEDCKISRDAHVVTVATTSGLGNYIVDYELVLKKGLAGVMAHARSCMDALDLTCAENVKKQWFLKSCLIACEGVIHFANRLADACERMAVNMAETRRSELLRIAENLRRVPEHPARNFYEGVQSVWLILLAQHIESNGKSISIGRFDQYLYELYRADLDSGRLTREAALEIVEAFFIKCNEIARLAPWSGTAFFQGYQLFINMTVAGQKQDGGSAVNDLTWLCVDACRELKLITPSVSIRCFDGIDPEFIDYVLKAVREHAGGQPCFYSDKAFYRTLRLMGVAEEDVWNWACDGCIEACIPGKWDYAAKGPWLNTTRALELTLNDGRDPATGKRICPGYGALADFPDMEALAEAYEKTLLYFMRQQVVIENIDDQLRCMHDVNAFRSALMADCIERGKGMIEGGTVYSSDGGPVVGANTSGDALAAIEYAVFQEKLLTPQQLMHALNTNFEDETTEPSGEMIRAMLMTRPPKFGNDDDAADKWPLRILDFIGTHYQQFRNSRWGKGPAPANYSLNLSPVTGNIPFGKNVGATADGRKAGMALNNGISPCNGAEKSGPTAAANSVAKMPTQYLQKGGIFNMRFSERTFDTREGRDGIAAIIRTLFDNYGMEVQFNVVDNDTLRDAQAHPENYADLMVRISGYSALFTPLSREIQNDLIERTAFESAY